METLTFSQYILLEELIIGGDCFGNIDKLVIDGLNHLKSLKIGKNSFTRLKSGDERERFKASYSFRSLHILNCIELESIEIGMYSFSDYGSGFELKNLPKLSTIKIGEIGSWSRNFYYSSFVVEGIMYIYC